MPTLEQYNKAASERLHIKRIEERKLEQEKQNIKNVCWYKLCQAYILDILCDKCNTKLHSSEFTSYLMGQNNLKPVHCPKCKFEGNMVI